MCGILGIGGPRGRRLTEALLPGLARRGPDAEGSWHSPELTLGHRRLTVIGLEEEGIQPRLSRSRQSLLVFNGEIYNYRELADRLESEGRPCDRRFDSAVLLEALEAWGVEALPELDGMFALAWYRPRARRLLLARDGWGKKPLFWGTYPWEGRRHLAFSSELRTFAGLPGGAPAPDALGVARYLVYDGMPAERTIYSGVAKVAAGSWLLLDPEGVVYEKGRFWRPEASPVEVVSADQAEEELLARLARSLRRRLTSDVPVGLFLSGGIDSSLLAALWSRELGGAPIRTFTVGFEEASYDERDSARRMARAVGAEHHELTLKPLDLADGIDEVLGRLPEPLADPSLIPTALLCRFARPIVTVALGGDGGDELQAGYAPFRAWATASRMRSMLPSRVWGPVLERVERWLPADPANMSLKFKLHHFRQGLSHGPEERIQAWMASFPVHSALAAMRPELAESVDPHALLAPTRRAFRVGGQGGPLQAQIQTWIETYLESSILAKVDRAGMMYGLEVRFPFLEKGVAEWLLGLPPALVFRRGRGKVLLRRAARRLIPPSLASKPKKGLGVPLGLWLDTVLREPFEEALGRAETGGWFRPEVISRLWQEHRSGRYDHRKALWSFLVSSRFW